MSVLFVGAIITVVLRWYARVYILRRAGYEDYLVTGALVCGCSTRISMTLLEGRTQLRLSHQKGKRKLILCYFSQVTSIVWFVSFYVAERNGLGIPLADMTLESRTTVLKVISS